MNDEMSLQPASAAAGLKSLEDLVRARRKFDGEAFRRHLFWSSMRWYTVPLVWAIRAAHPTFFERDELLLTQVARATSLSEVKADVREYRRRPERRGLLRGPLRARISTRHVLEFAAKYFPSAPGR